MFARTLEEYLSYPLNDLEVDETDFIVYALIDPRNSEPFYVGRTMQLKTRMAQHDNSARRAIRFQDSLNAPNFGDPKDRYIADLFRLNLQYEVMILEKNARMPEVNHLEFEWALTLKAIGYPIQNKLSGMVKGRNIDIEKVLGEAA